MFDLFFLQDSRSNVGSRAMFWRSGGGYTSNINEAEQFTWDNAVKQYQCRESDLPYPVRYVRDRAEVGVDSQYLSRSDAEAYCDEDGRVYVAYAREWDGNDLVWFGGKGSTSNLEDAIHPDGAETVAYLAQGLELWPCGYIVERSRPVVRASVLDHKGALRSVGLKLPKLARPRYRSYSNRLNCDGCGRFLTEPQRFETCPNCGARNAP
ncbi:hypothetical protein D3C81_765500 [compost metagenome]